MTNNSNEEQSDLFNTPSLKQKGIDMRPAYYAKGKEPAGYDSSIFVNVPVGQTKTFQKAYKLPYPTRLSPSRRPTLTTGMQTSRTGTGSRDRRCNECLTRVLRRPNGRAVSTQSSQRP